MATADYSSFHQPSGTGADGTKLDNFIDAVQATVNDLDTNNLAANAGIKTTQLASVVKTTVSTLAGGPPFSPSDTDIWIATNVDALGTRWAFQFNAASASAFKWEFIGGGTAVNDVATSESTASTTNADLTTGQAITLVRPGDYKGEFSSVAGNSAVADTYMTLVLASTEKWLSSVRITSGGITASLAGAALITGVTAGQVLKAQFRVGAGTGTWSSRHLGVVPLRVS